MAVLVAVAAWAAVSAATLWSAYGHAQDGLTAMTDVRSSATQDLPTFIDSIGGDEDDLPEEVVDDQLAVAATAFSEAHSRMVSPALAPLRILPVIGRQIRSVTSLSAAAATTATNAGTAFRDLAEEIETSAQTPEDRLASGQRTEQVLRDLQASLSEVDLGPDNGLLGPLARARNRFTEEYDHTMETLGTAVTSVTGVNQFLTGPGTYLILAANNSEMRSGSGMYLQVGTMTVDQGRFELSDFEPAGDLLLEQPGAVMDPDIERLWGWLLPNQEWRNLNLSPRFEESARMAKEMWAAKGRGDVDGVIAIDVMGLQQLLQIVGPVQVAEPDGSSLEISADNVRQELLLNQYLDFRDANEERRERLGRVGTAVFESFNERSFSASRLLQALQEAGAGRHILLWSPDPTEEDAWVALGASGVVTDDTLLLAMLNRGGNKLDQFLDVEAKLSLLTTGDTRRITVDVRITNSTPPDLPRYVAGPFPGTDVVAGEYVGILALTVPGGAGNPSLTGGEFYINGDDGPTRLLSTKIAIEPGGVREISFQFDLPDSWSTVQVVPSARTPEIRWTAGGVTWPDDAPRSVDLQDLD